MLQQLYPEKNYPQGQPDLAMNLNDLGSLYKEQAEYGLALRQAEAACRAEPGNATYLTTLGMHAYTDTGVIGQPSLATADKGRALLDHLAKAAHPLIALLTGDQH